MIKSFSNGTVSYWMPSSFASGKNNVLRFHDAQSTEPKDGALGIVLIFWNVIDSAAKTTLLLKQANFVAELWPESKSRVQSPCPPADDRDVTDEWSLTSPILGIHRCGEAG